MALKHYADSQQHIEDGSFAPGSLLYTNIGNHYIVNGAGTKVKITDVIFTDLLPPIGIPNKLYISKKNLYLYDLTLKKFVLIGGGSGESAIPIPNLTRLTYDGDNITKTQIKSLDESQVYQTVDYEYKNENIVSQTAVGTDGKKVKTTYFYDDNDNIIEIKTQEVI